MEKKPLNKMTISDVMNSPEGIEVAKSEIERIKKDREQFIARCKSKGQKFKKHPIDDLKNDGYLEPSSLISLYLDLCDKKPVEMTRKARAVIVELGSIVFHETMRVLITKDEEKGNSTNRHN